MSRGVPALDPAIFPRALFHPAVIAEAAKFRRPILRISIIHRPGLSDPSCSLVPDASRQPVASGHCI